MSNLPCYINTNPYCKCCYGYGRIIVFPSVFLCFPLSCVPCVSLSVSVSVCGVAYLSWLLAWPLQSEIIPLTCSACTPAPHLLISKTVYLLWFCINSLPDCCFSPSGTHWLLAALCLLMLRVIPCAHDTLYLPVVSLCLQDQDHSFLCLPASHPVYLPACPPAHLPFTPRLSPSHLLATLTPRPRFPGSALHHCSQP